MNQNETKSAQNLWKQITLFSPEERLILFLFTMCGPISNSAFLTFLHRYGFSSLKFPELKKIMAKFQELFLMVPVSTSQNQSVLCSELGIPFFHSFFELVHSELFSAGFRDICLKGAREFRYFGYWSDGDPQTFNRYRIWLSVFSGDGLDLGKAFAQSSAFTTECLNEFGQNLESPPESLSDSVLSYFLQLGITKCLLENCSSGNWFHRALVMMPFYKAQNYSILLPFFFLRGDFEQIAQFPNSSYGNPLKEGFLHLISGELKKADLAFGRAMQYSSGEPLFWNIPLCLVMLHTALKTKSKSRSSALVRSMYKIRLFAESFQSSPILDVLFNGTFSEIVYKKKLWSESSNPLACMFDAMAIPFLSREAAASFNFDRLKKAADSFRKNNWLFPAYQIYAGLAPFDSGAGETAAEMQGYSALGTGDLLKSEWERMLDDFSAAADAGTERKNSPEQLFWNISVDSENPESLKVESITPVVRKMLKSGRFGSGKSISLQMVATGKVDCLLDEPGLKIKSLIRYHAGSWYTSKYSLSESSLSHLIDRPNVLLEGSPVRVRKGEIVLLVRRGRNGGTRVSIPCMKELLKQDCVLKKVESGLCLFYQLTPAQKRIAVVLEKYAQKGVLNIPPEGSAKFTSILTSVADRFRVSGELDVDNIDVSEKVEGRIEFHCQLDLSPETLTVYLKNKPSREHSLLVSPGRGNRHTLFSEGEKQVVIVRDLALEHSCRDQLLLKIPSLEGWEVSENKWEIPAPDEALKVLGELHDKDLNLVLDWPEGQGVFVSKPISLGNIRMEAQFSADTWFSVGGEVKVSEDSFLRLSELLRKLTPGTKNFIRLDEKHYLQITSKLLRQLQLLHTAGTLEKDSLILPKAAIPALAPALENEKSIPEIMKKNFNEISGILNSVPEIPSGIRCVPRDYQKNGFRWLWRLTSCGLGGCLADDMGLGKTIQILLLLLSKGADGPSLVIAPASVCANWKLEAERFFPRLNLILFSESDRLQTVHSAGKFDVVVSSYGLAVSETELLAGRQWNAVILDEAQSIKNQNAKRAGAVKQLQSRIRVAVTGTPIENNLADLWSLFDFLNPGLLGSSHSFLNRYSAQGAMLSGLKKILGPLLLRRLKAEVMEELPEKMEITMKVELYPEERTVYEQVRLQALTQLSEESGTNQIAILAHLTKLRRICCHPVLAGAAFAGLPGSKLDTLMNLLADLKKSSHKALIFSQFVDCLSLVRRRVEESGYSYRYLDGSTPVKDRAGLVSAFQHGEVDFFLISLKAGGVGLNLTAANYVILLDPWWNPAVENQAADRVHRIGQKNPVTVYRLVASKTVEEKVMELHREKRELAENVLAGNSEVRLSGKDLMELFHAV